MRPLVQSSITTDRWIMRILCGAILVAAAGAAVASEGLDLQREIDAAAAMGGGVVRVEAGEHETRHGARAPATGATTGTSRM